MMVASATIAAPVASAGPAVNKCPAAGGVKVLAAESPATIAVTDTRTNTSVDVVVTITGTTFTIAPATGGSNAPHALVTTSWCVKSALKSTDPSPGTTLSGSGPSYNKQGIQQDIGYVTVYTATTGTCYPGGVYGDIAVSEPVGPFSPAAFYPSTDGTCSGPYGYSPNKFAVTSAPERGTAESFCSDFGTVWSTLQAYGYSSVPSDWWLCQTQTY